MNGIFTVQKWNYPRQEFADAQSAVAAAVELLKPSNKAGLHSYLKRELMSHFAVEYEDVIIRHWAAQDSGTKRLPKFTYIEA